MPPTTPPMTSGADVDLLSRQVELMTRMNALLEQQYDRLSAIQGALEGQAGVTQQAAGAIQEYNDASSQMNSSNDQIKDSLNEASGMWDTFTGKIKEFVGSEAYDKVTNGLSEGFQMLGINVSSLASAISNPIGAISGLVMGFWDTLMKKVTEIYEQMLKLAEAQERIREKFGSFNENTSRRTLTAYKNLGSTFKTTQENASQFAKKFPIDPFAAAEKRIEISIGLMEDMGATIDYLGQQFNDATDNLYLLKNGLNFSAEAMKQTAVLSQLSGKTLKQFSSEIMASVDKIGKQFNISTKVLGQDVGKALSNFKLLGRMTGDYVKEMTKAAVFTRKLGIEINELTGLVDKFDEFEGGAEAAAQLAQGFGMVLDPLKMMGMEVGPRLQEMQRAFMATGRSIDSMSRQERKLLADTAGLTEEQALLAFSAKGMSMSYDEISKGSEAAMKKQKSHEEIMNDMLDNIQNVISSLGPFTGFIDAFFKGISAGFGKGMLPTMMELAKSLGKVAATGMRVGTILFDIIFPSKDAEKSSVLSFIESIGTMFENIAKHIETFMEKVKGGDIAGAVSGLLNDVWGDITSTFSFEGGDFSGMMSKIGETLLGIFTGAVEWLANKLPEWTDSLTKMFTEETSEKGGTVDSSWNTAMTRLQAALPRLMESLPNFIPALMGAVGRMFTKYPWVGLFIAGGPLMTWLGGLSGGLFSALGGLFGGTGAAAAGAAAGGVDAAQLAAAKQVGEATGSTVTEGATAVVSGSQGMMDKLFNLVEDPAKIALMAYAIKTALVAIGDAVRDIMLSFMDPLPGREDGKSFIDIVKDSAQKFKEVSAGDLLALALVLGGVGLAIGMVLKSVAGMASGMSIEGVAFAAVGTWLAAKTGILSSITEELGRVIGMIGEMVEQIAAPFGKEDFRKNLTYASSMTEQTAQLSNVAASVSGIISSVVAINAAVPTGLLGGKKTGDLLDALNTAFTVLLGEQDGRAGLINFLNRLSGDASTAAAAAPVIEGLAQSLGAVGSVMNQLLGIPDVSTAKDKLRELTGAGDKTGFMKDLQALATWFTSGSNYAVDLGVVPGLANTAVILGMLTAPINILSSMKFGGGLFGGGGIIDQANKLIEFVPKMTESVNKVAEELPKMKLPPMDVSKQNADGIDAMFAGLDRYAAAIDRTTASFSMTKMLAFESKVASIVAHVATVRLLLENMGTMTLDATLDKFSENLNVAKQAFSIAGGAVKVNVNLNVTMNAEKLAGSLVLDGFVSPSKEFEDYLKIDTGDVAFDGLSTENRMKYFSGADGSGPQKQPYGAP